MDEEVGGFRCLGFRVFSGLGCTGGWRECFVTPGRIGMETRKGF